MKLETFNKVVSDTLDTCLTVLAEKGKEYALTADRLEHFKIAGEEQGVNPKEALWGMLSKHLASLNAMCRNGSDDKGRWAEKLTDSINYLLLLGALIEEEFTNEKD